MRALYVGSLWPERNASAGGVRTWSLVDTCLKAGITSQYGYIIYFFSPVLIHDTNFYMISGWKVTYTTAARENIHTAELRSRGVECKICPPNSSLFDELLKDYRPDIVIFDRFISEEKFGWRVWKHSPSCLRVLDTQDLHSLRHLRERLAFSGKSIREISAARLGTWRTSHIPEPLSYTNRGL